MRNVNRSSALFGSPPNAALTSFFKINTSRDASFVRPPSRYAVGVFWTSLTISPTSWPLPRLGRPLGLPETPFLNRESSGGLPRPNLLIARTPHIVSGERSAVFAIRECDLDLSVCGLGSKFPTSEIDGPRSAITRDPFAPKLLENSLQCRHPLGLAISGDLY